MDLKIKLVSKPQKPLSKYQSGGLLIRVTLRYLHKCRIRDDIFKLLSGICISGTNSHKIDFTFHPGIYKDIILVKCI
jgi:hypothetical protein